MMTPILCRILLFKTETTSTLTQLTYDILEQDQNPQQVGARIEY